MSVSTPSIHSTQYLPIPGAQPYESNSYEQLCEQLRKIALPRDPQKDTLLSKTKKHIKKITEELNKKNFGQLTTDQEVFWVVEFTAAWLRLHSDDIFNPDHSIYRPIWIILQHQSPWYSDSGGAMRIIGHMFNSAHLTPHQQQWLLYSLAVRDLGFFAPGLGKNSNALGDYVHPVVLGNFIHFLQATGTSPDIQLLKTADSYSEQLNQQLQGFVDELSISEKAKKEILRKKRILEPMPIEGWVSMYKGSRAYLLPWGILSDIHEALRSFPPRKLSGKITPEEVLEHNFVSRYLLECGFGANCCLNGIKYV